MSDFLKFMPFFKVEEHAAGEPTVWGIATLEKVDHDGEMCDFADSKPAYQRWSDTFATKTAAAGQQLSLGNIRLQHGSEVGGKAVKLEFRADAAPPAIWLGSEPISDAIADQLRKGFYTGYSQGGSYKYRKCDTCKSDLPMRQGDNYCPKCRKNVTVRYAIKDLVEVSYVDSACTGEGFQHVKADGSTEVVKFRKADPPRNQPAGWTAFAWVGDPDTATTWALPIDTKANVEKSLRDYHAKDGAWHADPDRALMLRRTLASAAKANGIEQTPWATAKLAAIEGKMRKGMGTVSYLASIIEDLSFVLLSTDYEAEYEGDESDVPDMLDANLADLVDTFMAMADEETTELRARRGQGEKAMAMTPEQKTAARKSLTAQVGKALKFKTDAETGTVKALETFNTEYAKAEAALEAGDQTAFDAANGAIEKAITPATPVQETPEQTIARQASEIAALKAAAGVTSPTPGAPAAGTAPGIAAPAVVPGSPDATKAAAAPQLVQRPGEPDATKGASVAGKNGVDADLEDFAGDE